MKLVEQSSDVNVLSFLEKHSVEYHPHITCICAILCITYFTVVGGNDILNGLWSCKRDRSQLLKNVRALRYVNFIKCGDEQS